MDEYRIDFESLDWESPIEGVRHKAITDGTRKLRLVEYSPNMPLHWCEKGHIGLVLEGMLEIEFEKSRYIFKKGDGIFIPDGHVHRHRAKALTDAVEVILVEDA